jgi:DNA mismatch endonuclease (patch repair protein)
VFVVGRFWHGHPDFFTPGKSGDYWDTKIARTLVRDRIANQTLADLGWTVLRFWDFEVEDDLDRCVEEVVAAVAVSRKAQAASTASPTSAATIDRPTA